MRPRLWVCTLDIRVGDPAGKPAKSLLAEGLPSPMTAFIAITIKLWRGAVDLSLGSTVHSLAAERFCHIARFARQSLQNSDSLQTN